MSVRANKKKSAEKALSSVTEGFELVLLRLVESRSLLQLDGGDIPSKISIEVGVAFNVDQAKKAVGIRCECKASTEHEPNKEPAVFIAAAYECIYKAKSDKAMESAEQMLPIISMSAQFHAWPYLRRHIQNTSQEMNVPQILLPMYCPVFKNNTAKSDTPKSNLRRKAK